jgi:hypothetical protein
VEEVEEEEVVAEEEAEVEEVNEEYPVHHLKRIKETRRSESLYQTTCTLLAPPDKQVIFP